MSFYLFQYKLLKKVHAKITPRRLKIDSYLFCGEKKRLINIDITIK